MNREQCKHFIQGTIATIPTAFDKDYKLDLARMTDLTRWWIKEGLGTNTSPLKVAAAMGEGPDLSDDEWPQLLRTVVNAAGPDAVVLCGLKTKNTLHTIEDAKKAQDLGAKGLQIDLPLFHHPNQDDYVRYFSDISKAIDIGIMIYNTYWFGCESIQAQTMLQLKDTEHVIAIKWAVPEGQDYDEMKKFSGFFNVIDNSNQKVRCHKNGGRGFISGIISAYPQHDLKLWKLLEARKYDEAQAEIDKLSKALAPWSEKARKVSGGYRHSKAFMEAVGQPVGPTRPPTVPCTPQEVAELKTVFKGLGWIK